MKNLVFGIVGCSGSGKSYIVNYVKNNFDLDVISILLQDNYYKRREYQKKDSDGNYNFDLPSSFLEDELFDDIKKIKNNSTVERLEYTFNNPKILPKKIIVKPRSVILVEGIFLFYYKNFQKLIDRKIFIDVDRNVGLNRRIKRDLKERGYDKNNVLYKYNNHVIPSYNKYILPYKNDADLIVNNTKNDNEAAKITLDYMKNEFQALNNNI
ncbi:MAG TPA: uridine kinase [Cytophagales bacterium]|nr:uridine kinase [Cytophagales bacterium]